MAIKYQFANLAIGRRQNAAPFGQEIQMQMQMEMEMQTLRPRRGNCRGDLFAASWLRCSCLAIYFYNTQDRGGIIYAAVYSQLGRPAISIHGPDFGPHVAINQK